MKKGKLCCARFQSEVGLPICVLEPAPLENAQLLHPQNRLYLICLDYFDIGSNKEKKGQRKIVLRQSL